MSDTQPQPLTGEELAGMRLRAHGDEELTGHLGGDVLALLAEVERLRGEVRHLDADRNLLRAELEAERRRSAEGADPVMLARYRARAGERAAAEALVDEARRYDEGAVDVEELAKALGVDDEEAGR